jgi:hypothetical protein
MRSGHVLGDKGHLFWARRAMNELVAVDEALPSLASASQQLAVRWARNVARADVAIELGGTAATLIVLTRHPE